MTENQDLVERLIGYDIHRIAQIREVYHLMEKKTQIEYTLPELQKAFRGFPVKDKELTLFLDLHARCNGNSGLVFEEAIHQRVENALAESKRYENLFINPTRN